MPVDTEDDDFDTFVKHIADMDYTYEEQRAYFMADLKELQGEELDSSVWKTKADELRIQRAQKLLENDPED